jgi:hypothetical protein
VTNSVVSEYKFNYVIPRQEYTFLWAYIVLKVRQLSLNLLTRFVSLMRSFLAVSRSDVVLEYRPLPQGVLALIMLTFELIFDVDM